MTTKMKFTDIKLVRKPHSYRMFVLLLVQKRLKLLQVSASRQKSGWIGKQTQTTQTNTCKPESPQNTMSVVYIAKELQSLDVLAPIFGFQILRMCSCWLNTQSRCYSKSQWYVLVHPLLHSSNCIHFIWGFIIIVSPVGQRGYFLCQFTEPVCPHLNNMNNFNTTTTWFP